LDLRVPQSTYVVLEAETLKPSGSAEMTVEVVGADLHLLPCRVVVTASDGTHPEGTGNGVYSDGRFFCEGQFTVTVPIGRTEISIRKGPSYVPLSFIIDAQDGVRLHLRAYLQHWFSPEEKGWYGCDHHVHSQHDTTAQMKTGLEYTALQGRANGLSYITEAGSNVSYEGMDQLSTSDFLLRYCPELKEACYTGHVNTPGLNRLFTEQELLEMARQPLFTQVLTDAVHSRNGVVIYTHPLTPAHQLHWMGASEVFSDAVMGRCADLFDVDSKATEFLWFSMLNLGNRVGCSSYTDSTLERAHTLTPGDRRVYCHAGSLDEANIVDAMRQGRTFATNGGPLFGFFSVDQHEPGDTLDPDPTRVRTCRAELHSLHPLKSVEFIRCGQVVKSIDVSGKQGHINRSFEISEAENSWYVLRTEDERGHWCITSPIYFGSMSPARNAGSCAVLMEIANHTRYVYLESEFFLHLLVTVSPTDAITEVQLLRNGEVYDRFYPSIGESMPSGRIPVTELDMGAPYERGWLWYPSGEQKFHFQLDDPINESGWYSAVVVAASGAQWISDAVYFDGANPHSQELSLAQLWSERTEFTLWGYGEEMPLDEVPITREDRWWYPQNAVWQVHASFDGVASDLHGEHAYHAEQTTPELPMQIRSLFRKYVQE